MKTKVRNTSLGAYFYIRGNGTDLNQKGKIINELFVAGKALTRAEISERSGIRLNAVCGRINELINADYVTELGIRLCSVTNFSAHSISLTSKAFNSP